MKQILLMLSVLFMTGCDPFPADQSSTSDSVQNANTQSNSDETIDYKSQNNIRISDNEIVIYKSSGDIVQTVKRVEDKDAVCWVTMNSKNWESSISCLPRNMLQVPVQSVKPSNETTTEVQQ